MAKLGAETKPSEGLVYHALQHNLSVKNFEKVER